MAIVPNKKRPNAWANFRFQRRPKRQNENRNQGGWYFR